MQSKRLLGSIAFLVLRNKGTQLQQVVAKREAVSEQSWKTIEELKREALVHVEVEERESKHGKELFLKSIEVIAEAEKLPLEFNENIGTEQSTRQRYRCLEIRQPKQAAILKIRSELLAAAREFFRNNGFTEVALPLMIGSGTEGGAELFQIEYYGRKAFLSQSGQLYKQASTAAFEKVFAIQPTFRAEKSHTRKHITEFWTIECEMAFAGAEQVMETEEALVRHIFKCVKERCVYELGLLGIELPQLPEHFARLGYEEALKKLEQVGKPVSWEEGWGAEEERILCSQFSAPFFITEFPTSEVSFYYKKKPGTEGKLSERIDLLGFGPCGYEWSSGGVREHRRAELEQRMHERGLNPKNLEWYLEMFSFGMPPHGGFGLGVERILQTMLKLENIRQATLFPRTPEVIEP